MFSAFSEKFYRHLNLYAFTAAGIERDLLI